MKKLLLAFIFGSGIILSSCGGGESAEACANKYCELHSKVDNAKNEEESLKARKEMNDYENELEKTHKGDEAFFKKFEEAVEKTCKAG